jgi:hypothetical protein
MDQIHITSSGAVYLTLPAGKSFKRTRKIGVLQSDTFVTRRSDATGSMHNREEIGFNYEFMRYGPPFRYVEIHFFPSGRVLRIKRQTILDYGEIMHLKHNKLDRQLYLKMSDANKPPIIRKAPPQLTRPITSQEDFFTAIETNDPPP